MLAFFFNAKALSLFNLSKFFKVSVETCGFMCIYLVISIFTHDTFSANNADNAFD